MHFIEKRHLECVDRLECLKITTVEDSYKECCEGTLLMYTMCCSQNSER